MQRFLCFYCSTSCGMIGRQTTRLEVDAFLSPSAKMSRLGRPGKTKRDVSDRGDNGTSNGANLRGDMDTSWDEGNEGT